MNIRRTLSISLLLVGAVVLALSSQYRIHPSKVQAGIIMGVPKVRAQYGPTVPIGFAAPASNLNTLAVSAGAAGTVTNTSGFLMQVDGGPVWCNGGLGEIAEDNIVLVANTTYMIVYSCPLNAVYAKTAVTAPGTLSPNQPGVPVSLLYQSFGEIALATVVCGATTCATITDNRPLNAFPIGLQVPTTLFANLPATFPNGSIVYCSNCLAASSPCTGASTGAFAIRVNGAWRCQ
jgi:hypothetical protein